MNKHSVGRSTPGRRHEKNRGFDRGNTMTEEGVEDFSVNSCSTAFCPYDLRVKLKNSLGFAVPRCIQLFCACEVDWCGTMKMQRYDDSWMSIQTFHESW